MAANNLLDRLSDFLDEDSPDLTDVICRMWKDQQSAITYRELRDAILDGSLSIDYLDQWRQDYSAFVAEHYAPMVQNAVSSAAKSLLEEYNGKIADPQTTLMGEYISQNGSKLIREISEKQYLAINTLVRQATLTSTMTVDQLARAIRPCIGLTQRQAATANEMYKQLREEGLSHKKALEEEIKYASREQRYRAATIAQTEMAFAYNAGCDAVVQQNVEIGNVGDDSTKEWYTARDERVCKICGSMHGETIPLDGVFSNGSSTPPGHPCCRCTLQYHLTKPKVQPSNQASTDEPLEQEEDLFADEWFEDGVVSSDVYEAVSDDMWDNNFEPSNKRVREMVDSVFEYTGKDYTNILAAENGFEGRFEEYSQILRPEERAKALRDAENINEFLSMSTPHSGTVYRGMGFDVGGMNDNGSWKSFRSLYKKGNVIQTDTMTSWTSKKSYVDNIISARTGLDDEAEYSVEVYMTMRNGKTGVSIRDLAELKNQEEVLFPKTKLRVLDFREEWVDDELMRVYVELSEEAPMYGF